MDIRYYESIVESFKDDHPYLARDLYDWRPRGDKGIRIILNDGTEYDYDIVSRGARRVKNFTMPTVNDITDEQCRASIAYHLNEYMTMRGFTQYTLAEYTGLSKASIHNYMLGKATPSATALRKIAHALDCNISDLMD